MKNIDVFIDLEGLGISWGLEGSLRKIEFIANELPQALRKKSYELNTVVGFACYKAKNRITPPWIQSALRKAFTSHNWTMVWSDGIADLALIANVHERLTNGTLAEAVMLIANDHDFLSLVRSVIESGRHVIVSGPGMNKRLQNAGSEALPFWEFLGGHPEKILPGDTQMDQYKSSMPNPLPLPDIEF